MPPKTRKPSLFSGLANLFIGRRSRSGKQAGGPAGSSSQSQVISSPFPPVRSLHSLSADAETSTSVAVDAENTINLSSNSDRLSPVSSISFLSGALHFRAPTRDFNLLTQSLNGWELLSNHIALNALYDSSARFDAPKCDEDTRVEVTNEIMDWMRDRDGPTRLLVMTGPAGSGKSALQQTIAERIAMFDILASAFFFSSSDPSRNTLSSLVPTMAYQIGARYPPLKALIIAAVEADKLIFSKSLRTQFSTLIGQPIMRLRESAEADLCSIPYAVLIDGLDECHGEDRQAELLSAIDQTLLQTELPFRIFVASRPEWAIRSALQSGGYLHEKAYHIQLGDRYDATGDIRQYIQRRLRDIGRYRLADPEWPHWEDIENLVRAASGQFIYAATVVKYISDARFSPAERLRIVIRWTPHEGQISRPFEALDQLYTSILLNAKLAYEAVDTHHGRDFLLLVRFYQVNATSGFPSKGRASAFFSIDDMTALLGLEMKAEETLFSDLRSLVTLTVDGRGQSTLQFYHQTFSHYLEAETRAKDTFVPTSRVQDHLTLCCLQTIASCSSRSDTEAFYTSRRNLLDSVLRHLPYFLKHAGPISDELLDFTRQSGWHTTDRLLEVLDVSKRWPDFHEWISAFPEVVSHLEKMGVDPKVVAEMNEFVKKLMSKI